MQDIFVTKEEFNEKYENICKGIDELKEKYHVFDKKMEVIGTKIDTMRVEFDMKIDTIRTDFDTKTNTIRVESKQDINALRTEMNERFNSTNEKLNALRTEMNEKFNSLEKRFMMMWTLMVIILLAILGLYLRGMF